MKNLLILFAFITTSVFAQDTVSFVCTDGINYSFVGMPCCSENAPGISIKYYYHINDNHSIVYHSIIVANDKVTEWRSVKITPKLVTEMQDAEGTSAVEQNKRLFTLYVFEDPMADVSKTIEDRAVIGCQTQTDNGILHQWSGYDLFFDSKEALNLFVEKYNRLK